jgi:hypothetical protein
MKSIARSLLIVLLALIAVPALVVSVTITATVQLLATTALIMGGTQHPLSPDVDSNDFVTGYMNQAINNFINPGYRPTPTPSPINTVAVIYPAQFAPVNGTTTFDDSVEVGRANLSHCLGASVGGCNYNTGVGSTAPKPAEDQFIVFGYSQSAVVASLVKNQLIEDHPASLDGTNFVLIANPMRPNGGILGRGFEGMTIPIIGITFYGPTENSCPANGCTPGDTFVTPTVDVAQQYDFLGGDAPARPLNVLAMTNSLMAYGLLHGNVPTHSLTEPGMIDQGQYGDTHYYMIPADTLPILQPLVMAGVPAPALALPDAILRVWIEDAYVRDKSAGEHVTFQWSPIGNPIGLIGNTLGAIPVGIDDTVEGFSAPGTRPLGTQPAGPFGVGGPNPDQTPALTTARSSSPHMTVVEDKSSTPEDTKLVKEKDQGNVIEDATPEANQTPKATKPDPFADLRKSLHFSPDNRPSSIRPNGDGPLKRIVKALTGQKEKDTASNAESAAKAPAA